MLAIPLVIVLEKPGMYTKTADASFPAEYHGRECIYAAHVRWMPQTPSTEVLYRLDRHSVPDRHGTE